MLLKSINQQSSRVWYGCCGQMETGVLYGTGPDWTGQDWSGLVWACLGWGCTYLPRYEGIKHEDHAVSCLSAV